MYQKWKQGLDPEFFFLSLFALSSISLTTVRDVLTLGFSSALLHDYDNNIYDIVMCVLCILNASQRRFGGEKVRRSSASHKLSWLRCLLCVQMFCVERKVND